MNDINPDKQENNEALDTAQVTADSDAQASDSPEDQAGSAADDNAGVGSIAVGGDPVTAEDTASDTGAAASDNGSDPAFETEEGSEGLPEEGKEGEDAAGSAAEEPEKPADTEDKAAADAPEDAGDKDKTEKPEKNDKTDKKNKPKRSAKATKTVKPVKKSFGPGAVLLMILTAVVFVVFCGWLSMKFNINGRADEEEKPVYGVLGSYYGALTAPEKRLYSELAFCADNSDTMSEILPFGVTSLEFDHALTALTRDEADMFHIKVSGCAADTSADKSVLTLAFRYDAATAGRMRSELRETAGKLADEIAPAEGGDAYDTILALHDKLISLCVKYDGEGDNVSNAYGALVEGKANAEGYAYAVREVLTVLGIPSAVVYGSVGGEDHVWNIVSVGDEWYHLDCWFDDADSELEPDMPMHAWFMVSDEVVADRAVDTGITLPECGGEFDYYRRYAYSCGDADSLGGVLNTAINNADHDGERFFELLAPPEITREEILDLTIDLIKDHNATRTASMTPAPYPEARIYPTGRAGAYTIELYY